MSRIIDIFGRRDDKDSYFFLTYVFWRDLYERFIYKNILTLNLNVRLFPLHFQASVSESYDPRLSSIVL